MLLLVAKFLRYVHRLEQCVFILFTDVNSILIQELLILTLNCEVKIVV